MDKDEFEEWVSDKPKIVQEMAERFPVGSIFVKPA